jgi:ABC-type amino acid transport system permease subunit
VDSFYETMLKASILLNDNRLLSWFRDAYTAVQMNTVFMVLMLLLAFGVAACD